MSVDNRFEKHFDYGSFLPVVLFILGIYVSFLFVIEKYSQGIFVMLISFVVYVLNNLINNLKENTTYFNEYLEDMGVFLTFGIAPTIFGLNFYEQDFIILLVVFFYAISQVLGLARNHVSNDKNTRGWPAPLNGLFFPFMFYIYIFYLQDMGNSIFIFYYILIGILSVSEYNFLGYKRDSELQSYRATETNVNSDKSISSLHDLTLSWKEKLKDKEEKEEKEIEQRKENEKKTKVENEKKLKEEKERKLAEEIERKKKLKEEEEILVKFDKVEEIKNKKDLGLDFITVEEKKKKWYQFFSFSSKKKKD